MNIPDFVKRNYPYLIIIVVVLAVFSITLSNGFVYDDNVVLVGNPVFKDFDVNAILFSLPTYFEYFPLRDLTYAVDYALWGENAFGFHLTNLLIYIVLCLLLFRLFRELSILLLPENSGHDVTAIALFAVLLFAVHPTRCETVNWIMARGGLMSATFLVSACIFYLGALDRSGKESFTRYALALVSFLMALLSKSYHITLPLLLLLICYMKREKINTRNILQLIPFFLLAAGAYFFYTIIGKSTGVTGVSRAASLDVIMYKIALSAQIFVFYLYKLIWPVKLSVEYDIEFASSLMSLKAVLSLIVIAVLFLAALIRKKRYPVLLFSLLWYLFTVLPFLRIIEIGTFVSDRYAFVPLMPFFLAAAFLILSLRKRFGGKLVYACLLGIVATLSAASMNYNIVWASEMNLWKHVVRQYPYRPKGHHMLGVVYFEEEKYGAAFEELKRAQDLDPSDAGYEHYRGQLAFARENYSEAAKWFRIASEKDTVVLLHKFMHGRAEEEMGNLVEAAGIYSDILYGEGHSNVRGTRQKAARRLEEVRRALSDRLGVLKRSYEANPGDPKSSTQYALLLHRIGYHEEALKVYEEIIDILGPKWEVYLNIASIYNKIKDYPMAEKYYIKSLEIKPDNSRASNNLGIIYKNSGRYAEAISSFENSLKSDPSYGFALVNLAKTYFEMGDTERARKHFELAAERFPSLKPNIYPYLERIE